MKTRRKWSNNAFIFITAIFALALFSLSDVSAAPTISAEITRPGSNMLQFKTGNHILGFAPDKAYLASMDHALSVEFLGTKGVMPKADSSVPSSANMIKAQSLSKVIYQNLWDGISLTYEATKDGITETTYHVAPGGDVSKIRLKYNVPVELQKDGSLKFKFDAGNLTESVPIAWQDIDGKRVPVKVVFKVVRGEIGFSVEKYDKTFPLIIDPIYAWHTFYGSNYGSNYPDNATGIATDSGGNVYITGYSWKNWNGPADQAPLNSSGDIYPYDIFVLKLDSSGAYQWHTFFGSDNIDEAYGITVDGSDNVYVIGNSFSGWNGPAGQTPLNAFSGASSSDIFVLKLTSSGAYLWHTFYGSSDADSANSIAIGGDGNIYVTGRSYANWDGPASQAPLNAYSDYEKVFILKLDSSGTYQWHTFYGSDSGNDGAWGIAVDSSGNAYVTGYSSVNWNGPAGQPALNGVSGNSNDNIFILKLDGSGVYQWHTFYGSGIANDYAYSLAIDSSSHIYVTGYSGASWNGPAGQAPLNSSGDIYPLNIFVLKLDSGGSYQWHTFYGSGSYDLAQRIIIDSRDNVYVRGYSWASWNGSADQSPLNAFNGDKDIFILKLNRSGVYQWHTFYLSTSEDLAYSNGIATDKNNNIYVAGHSNVTWGSPLHDFSGGQDIFVLKMAPVTCPANPVKIEESDIVYPSISAAYSAAASGNKILMQGLVFDGALTLASDISVTLKGGYNECDFSSQLGYTTIPSLTISRGTVTVENLIIK